MVVAPPAGAWVKFYKFTVLNDAQQLFSSHNRNRNTSLWQTSAASTKFSDIFWNNIKAPRIIISISGLINPISAFMAPAWFTPRRSTSPAWRLTTIWPLLCNCTTKCCEILLRQPTMGFSCFWHNCAEPTKFTFQRQFTLLCRSFPTEYLFSTVPLYILRRKNNRIIVCICGASFEIFISIEGRFFMLLNYDSCAILNSAKLIANLISNTSCIDFEFRIR
mgnify:FL=1